jgi:hypothetical protein
MMDALLIPESWPNIKDLTFSNIIEFFCITATEYSVAPIGWSFVPIF